jgi:hypothetical protein
MRRLRFAVLVAFLAIPLTPTSALACRCIIPGEIPTHKEVDARSRMFPRAMFEATVSSIWEGVGPLKSPVRLVFLRDHRAWRGRPAGVILNFVINDCRGITFEVGQRYLIDGAYRLPDTVVTGGCSLTRPIDLAADTIAKLKALTPR